MQPPVLPTHYSAPNPSLCLSTKSTPPRNADCALSLMIKAGHANIGLTNILRPECRNRKRGAMPPRCCSAEIERISGTATSIVIRVQRGRAARPLCTRIKGAERNKGLTYKRWWYHAVTRQCTAVAVGLGGHIWVTRSNSFGSSMGCSGRALLSKRRMRDQPR